MIIIEFLRSFNWVDALFIGILVRAIHVGSKNGFIVEIFKFAGIIFANFITLHYVSGFGRFIHLRIPFFSPSSSDVIAYCFLWVMVVFIFKLMRDGAILLIKLEANSNIDRWGGLIFSIMRGVIIGGMVVILLYVTDIKYMVKSSYNSISGKSVMNVSMEVYRGCFNGFIHKLFPSETINVDVMKLKKIRVLDKQT